MNRKIKNILLVCLSLIGIVISVFIYKKIMNNYSENYTFYYRYFILHFSFIISIILAACSFYINLHSVSKISLQLEFGRTRKEILKDIYNKMLIIILISIVLCLSDTISNYLLIDNYKEYTFFKNTFLEKFYNNIDQNVFIYLEFIKAIYFPIIITFSLLGSLYSSIYKDDFLLFIIIITDIIIFIVSFFNNLMILLIVLIVMLLINIFLFIFIKKRIQIVIF